MRDHLTLSSARFPFLMLCFPTKLAHSQAQVFLDQSYVISRAQTHIFSFQIPLFG